MESPGVIEIKNTLLLDYLLWDFTWDFENAIINDHIESTFLEFKERPEMIFKIEKISATQFKIEMKRTNFDSKTEQDAGYCLELIFSLFGDRELPKRQIMDFSTESVSVVYNISDMKKETENATYWIMKCVIKMHEETLLENDARKQQDELILNLKESNETHREKLKDMAYLMNRESLTDIFSGRQKLEFAIEKSSLIERTLNFADDIANKIRAKKNNAEHITDLPPEVYLQYIFNKNLESINECDVLSLYTIAHCYGLLYLADECVECMFNLLAGHKDNEYIVYILLNSLTTDDLQLMYKALDVFNEDIEAIKFTDAWKKLTEEKLIFKQIIEDEAKLRQQNKLMANLKSLHIANEEQNVKQHPVDEEPQKTKNLEEIGDKDSSEALGGTNEEERISQEIPTESSKTKEE